MIDERGLTTLLAALGYEFYKAHLIGGAPPNTEERLKRMEAIRANDLVMETTSGAWMFGRNGNYRTKPESAVGLLHKVTQEPVPFDEPWDEKSEGRPHPTEEVVYIRPLDGGQIIRWTNAHFITIIPIEGWGDNLKNPCLQDSLRDLFAAIDDEKYAQQDVTPQPKTEEDNASK